VIATATTVGGVKPSIFVYQPADVMSSGLAAPACRIGLPAERTSLAKWGVPMFAFFDRAVRWAAYGCGTNIIAVAAGNGTAVPNFDGSNAMQTGLQDPFGVVVDGQGGFYVSEFLGHRVRHVSAAGLVTTVAGTGTAGFSGEGQPAVFAQLRNPTRVRRDPQGRVVIVDSANHRIRRIEPDGTLITIAGNGLAGNTGDGGSALNARLSSPQDVTFAADGTMYIADRNNHKIRRVNPAGVISTFAGTGTGGYNGDEVQATTARLFNPYGVAVVPEGVLIADFDNNRVRLVDPLGVIHTVAGTGIATAGGDGGPAILADVHKPVFVAPRPGGGFLICDYNNNKVRVVVDGIISTIVGVGSAGYSGEGDLALFARGNRFGAIDVDSAGNLYVVDRFNARIRKVFHAF
jgi:NHL repeat